MNTEVRIKTLRFGLKRGIQGGVTVVVTDAVVFIFVTFPGGVVGVLVWVVFVMTVVRYAVGVTVGVGIFKSAKYSTVPFGLVVLPLLTRTPFL